MPKHNLMSERTQPDPRPIEAVIAEIEALYNRGRGPRPVDNLRYVGKKSCTRCGRPIATAAAYHDLGAGNGTNLCWGDCHQEADLTVPIMDVMRLVDEIRQLQRSHDEKQA